MPAFDDFKEKLLRTQQDGKWTPASKEHDALLSYVKGLVNISRKEMAKHFSTWDVNDSIFRSRRALDKEDKAAMAKGNAPKMIVPWTFSQVMTFVSFGVQSLMQEKRFFQLEPTGVEDDPLVEPIEKLLERDTKRNDWNTFLVQYFLDIGRFSLGCAEVCWEDQQRMVRVPQTNVVQGVFGSAPTEETTVGWVKIPVFEGNKVHPVSPYRFLPDTRLPLTRYQEGEFCGSEDMWALSVLKQNQNQGLFNLDCIVQFDEKRLNERRSVSRVNTINLRGIDRQDPLRGGGSDGEHGKDGFVKSGSVVITKMVFDLVPKDFSVGGEKGLLGDEDFPVRYICWIANDMTIVRFEEAYWLHGQFPYICTQFLPDQHSTVNESLAELCDQINSTLTWLINSSITSKRSNLEGKFVYDPSGIDPKSIESRDPYIRLKKTAANSDVRRYLQQLNTVDPTLNNLQEANQIKELGESGTGYSGIMQGQFSSGRRDATQSKVVTQGAAARAKTTLGSIWTSLQNLGRQFNANNRQEMSLEQFSRVLGSTPSDKINPETGAPWTIEELFVLFKAEPVTIASAEEFFIYDGTQPAEKAYLAQSLEGILQIVLSSPEVMQVIGYGPDDIRWLISQIYELRGVTPARLPKPKPSMLAQQQQQQNVLAMPTAAGQVPQTLPSVTSA